MLYRILKNLIYTRYILNITLRNKILAKAVNHKPKENHFSNLSLNTRPFYLLVYQNSEIFMSLLFHFVYLI